MLILRHANANFNQQQCFLAARKLKLTHIPFINGSYVCCKLCPVARNALEDSSAQKNKAKRLQPLSADGDQLGLKVLIAKIAIIATIAVIAIIAIDMIDKSAKIVKITKITKIDNIA